MGTCVKAKYPHLQSTPLSWANCNHDASTDYTADLIWPEKDDQDTNSSKSQRNSSMGSSRTACPMPPGETNFDAPNTAKTASPILDKTRWLSLDCPLHKNTRQDPGNATGTPFRCRGPTSQHPRRGNDWIADNFRRCPNSSEVYRECKHEYMYHEGKCS